MATKLTVHQSVVTDIDDIPSRDLKKLLFEILDRLGLQIIKEETPDYRVFSLKERGLFAEELPR